MRRGLVIAVIVFSLLALVIPVSCNETQETEAEAVIGPDGGVVEVTDPESPIFGTKLVIPEGVVDEDIVISLSEGIDGDDSELIGIPISCKPDGYLFNQEVALTIPLGGPLPEDDLLMLLVYNGTSGTYEYAGRLVEIHTDDTEATVNIDHFSSFQFMGADDYFGRLDSIQLLAASVWTIKGGIEAKDCTELNSIKQSLVVFQNDYEEAMEGFVAAHGWCLEHYTLSNLLAQTWVLVRDHVLIHGTASLLGVTLPTVAVFLSGVSSAVVAGLLLSGPLCFLWTSWLNPIFLNAWVGYTVCEYGIATIELALADPDVCDANFEDLVNEVSEVISPGVPGPVQAEVPDWVPIVAGDENAACADDTSGPKTFVMARLYEAGRVVIIGHDGLIANLDQLDNEQLVLNIISWLDASDGKRVTFSTGHDEWLTASLLDPLKVELESRGYSFESATAPISSSFLAGRDVLIVGNAAGTISSSEIDAVEHFVANGGGLFLIGLGWAWGHYHTEPIEEYPMMKLAVPYGVRWLECYLWDIYYDQTPVFDVFYPNIPEYGINLLLNPGFEYGLSWWSSTGGTATYESDISIHHTGSYSVKGIETSKGNLGRLYQDVTEIVWPGHKYKIGGWIKTEGIDGRVVIALDYVDSGGWSPADGYVKEIGYVSGTQDWTYYESDEFMLPPMPTDCVAAYFLFDFNDGQGSAWWDDVFLIKTG